MFAIIISEKGGAERRESFDKNEINVGRVQGNDLTLPKGNVSKHHARLLFRDGRFIVTDLKSTNGTYVNGRKIAQATIVREGDKIYIGDFVLRLESSGNPDGAAMPAPTAEGESDETAGREQAPAARAPAVPPNASPMVTLKAPTAPPGAPLPRSQPVNVVSSVGAPAVGGGTAASPEPPVEKPRQPSIPPPVPAAAMPIPTAGGRSLTMPLNQMSPLPMSPPGGPRPLTAPSAGGAIAAPPPMAPVPTPPQPVPTPAFPAAMPAQPLPQPGSARGRIAAPGQPLIAPQPAPAPAPTPAAAPAPMAPAGPAPTPMAVPATPIAAPAHAAPAPAPVAPPAPALAAQPVSRSVPPPRTAPKLTAAQAGRRLALTTLLDRVADSVDLAPLQVNPIVPDALARQLERAAEDGAASMRKDGDAPEGVDLDSIVRDAIRELVGTGPLGPLLDDDDVTEIHCVRFDQIVTRRAGAGVVTEPTTFSSEDALYRAVARLAQQSGSPWKPGETVVERRLARGALIAVAPPAASNHVVSIRKRRLVESSLDGLVQAGALSKSMAQFLEGCVAGHANILVCGSAPVGVVAALAASSGNAERVAIVQGVEDVGVGGAHASRLVVSDWGKNGEETVRTAAKLQADRLIVTQLASGVAVATIEALMEGSRGVLAALPSQSLRQGVARLVAQVAMARPTLSLEGMRDVVGEAFDIAIEVGTAADGRLRVTRIAELAGSEAKGVVVRDIFALSGDGEGTFGATGVVPRIAGDLATQGVKLDNALFKRGAK